MMPEHSFEQKLTDLQTPKISDLQGEITITSFAGSVSEGEVLYYVDRHLGREVDDTSEEFARHADIARHDLGRMALHVALKEAATQAETFEQFDTVFRSFTSPANIAGYQPKTKAKQDPLSKIYPVAFKPLNNFEQRAIPVVADYVREHHDDADAAAMLHVEQMHNLAAIDFVNRRLPYTHAYINSALNARSKNADKAESHWPLAVSLKRLLGPSNNPKKIVPVEKTLEVTEDDCTVDALMHAEVRLACLQENLTRTRARDLGSKSFLRLMNRIEDECPKPNNAQAINKVLYKRANPRGGVVDARMLISIANGLLKPLSKNYPDLGELDIDDAGNISQAIDRIMYAASVNLDKEQRAEYRSATHAARMYLMMGESFGSHKLSAADIHLRYPDTDPAQKAKLIRCMYELKDEFALHRRYLQLTQAERLPENFKH